MTRVIVHPNFINIDCAGAEEKMATVQQGDVMIRLSSQVSSTSLLPPQGCQPLDFGYEDNGSSLSDRFGTIFNPHF
jgi:hypothetical protein